MQYFCFSGFLRPLIYIFTRVVNIGDTKESPILSVILLNIGINENLVAMYRFEFRRYFLTLNMVDTFSFEF